MANFSLHFEVEYITGELKTSNETTEFGFFSLADAKNLKMNELDYRRVVDGFAQQSDTIICDNFEYPI